MDMIVDIQNDKTYGVMLESVSGDGEVTHKIFNATGSEIQQLYSQVEVLNEDNN